MQYNQAVGFFEAQMGAYNIPLSAAVDFIEKRIVEIAGQEKGNSDVLAWVCRYYEETDMRFFELTGTMDGKIIRFNTSM